MEPIQLSVDYPDFDILLQQMLKVKLILELLFAEAVTELQ
jgi:hypothetical protein